MVELTWAEKGVWAKMTFSFFVGWLRKASNDWNMRGYVHGGLGDLFDLAKWWNAPLSRKTAAAACGGSLTSFRRLLMMIALLAFHRGCRNVSSPSYHLFLPFFFCMPASALPRCSSPLFLKAWLFWIFIEEEDTRGTCNWAGALPCFFFFCWE